MRRLYWRWRAWKARVECRLRGYPPRPPLDEFIRPCVDGSLIHDFKGQTYCPACGFRPRAQRDRMYLDLKGAREGLCRTQTFVTHDKHRQALQDALDTIDRLGVFYAPDRWSKYDDPLLPGETPMRPSLEALGFTHVAECVECGHDIFKHPTWSHFGADGKGEGGWDHKAEARLGTIRDWPSA